MIEINEQTVIDGLTEIVNEYGENYVYPRPERCVYVHEGVPDCIVGKFLARVGIPLERLQEADEGRFSSIAANSLLEELRREGLVAVSHEAIWALRFVQAEQDSGRTWGEALQCAKERF